jgi:serine/threonine protein kinase/Flp pilus assembly protein TadD
LFVLEEELVQSWHANTPLRVEDVLARRPELRDKPEAVLRLILTEIALRRARGETVTPEEFQERFPRWRDQIQMLLDCDRLFQGATAPAPFPEVGQTVGEFRLVAELGRGSHSRVFLAAQEPLSDRSVVVKLVPPETLEHLCLARLQHTHIVPLYSAQLDPVGQWLLLCMPFVGSKSLAHLLTGLQDIPVGRRSGYHLLQVLDDEEVALPTLPRRGPARRFLARLSYQSALCWLGACLADAIQYAHDHDLVHLDLKPSNVLLTAEGQPMLLDFHLAQPPLRMGGPPPDWLGGTAAYMSPEQRQALAQLRQARPLAMAIDGRSDVFSLGVLLCEALGVAEGGLKTGTTVSSALGELRDTIHNLQSTLRRSSHVSPGLAAILSRCLEPEPDRRYDNAAALAADLRRHLNDQPLRGVPNPSLAERWQKWRRRHPGALVRWLVAGSLLGLCLVLGVLWLRRAWNPGPATPADWQDAQGQPAAWEQFRLGQGLLKDGNYQAAHNHLARAVELKPDSYEFQFVYGICAYKLQQAQAAVDAFGACIALSSGSDRAKAHVNRALAYTLLGKTTEALHDYDEALRLDPQLASAVLNRGVLHYQHGDYVAAVADLRQALELGADPEHVLFNLALAYNACHESTEAIKCLKSVLDRNPAHQKAAQLLEQLQSGK